MRADVYAVGTLMFEMLCGRVPFVGGSAAELLALKTGFEPPLPRLFAPTISPPLESFILRCLPAIAASVRRAWKRSSFTSTSLRAIAGP